MDPAIGWFQPEQCGQALSFWSDIWYTYQKIEKPKSNFKLDLTKSSDFSVNGNELHTSEDKKVPSKKIDRNRVNSSYCPRVKRKENKASTTGLDINDELFKNSGTPWRPKKKEYSQGLQGLHEEIEDFFSYMSPTNIEHLLRLEVVERITKIILTVFPYSKVEVYGSFRTGLYLPTSDIDLVVMEAKEISFRNLEQALIENNIAKSSSIRVLDKASVPIVKLTDAKTDIKIDISFNMNNGVKSANLIKDFMQTFPVLPKLVLVLKQFLLQRDLNEVFVGGISSYSLILLTISFLQHHESESGGSNLGNLLILFFEFYGKLFNYNNSGISVNDGGAYFLKEEFLNSMNDGNRPSFLCIEDPLLPGNDIGRSSYGALNVRHAFELAYKALSEAVRPSNNQIVSKCSILGRIVLITEEIIEYRKWIHEAFPLASLEIGSSKKYSHIIPYQVPMTTMEDKRRNSNNVNGNGSSHLNETPCSSCSSDCQLSSHSSCTSLGSSSSASSVISDTDSDVVLETLTNKQDMESEPSINSNGNKINSCCITPNTDLLISLTVNHEKAATIQSQQPLSSNGRNVFENEKSLKIDVKSTSLNGFVKPRKYSNSHDYIPDSNLQSTEESTELRHGVNSYAKKKAANRKDSINSINISTRKNYLTIER